MFLDAARGARQWGEHVDGLRLLRYYGGRWGYDRQVLREIAKTLVHRVGIARTLVHWAKRQFYSDALGSAVGVRLRWLMVVISLPLSTSGTVEPRIPQALPWECQRRLAPCSQACTMSIPDAMFDAMLEASPGAPAELPKTIIRPCRGWQTIDLGELWKYRELLYYLTWRDVKVRYKQTVLGAAWAILQPFMTMVVFSLLA